jgi:MarR family transcriptional regulator, 2-MHQ and catechol-resistance regulon repressor
MASRRSSSSLERDAADLYEAATAFIRIYQFRDRDHALRYGRLTVVQAYTLDILLTTGGQGLSGLARAIRLDKSTTSRVISGMTKHGLVEWSRPAHDRRAKEIVASPEGRRRYERLRRAIVRHNAGLLASYPRAARQAATAILWQLAQRASGAQAAADVPSPRARRTPPSPSRGV